MILIVRSKGGKPMQGSDDFIVILLAVDFTGGIVESSVGGIQDRRRGSGFVNGGRRKGRGGGRQARRYGRPWSVCVAWLAITGLLSLLFMPCPGDLLLEPDFQAGAVLACVVDGQPTPGPSSHLPQTPPPGHLHHGGCPFCIAHAGFSPPPPPPAAVAFVPLPSLAPSTRIVRDAGVPARPFLTRPQPRAPPASG